MSRSLTLTWQDPMPLAQAARSMSGLEFLRAVRDGPKQPVLEALCTGLGSAKFVGVSLRCVAPHGRAHIVGSMPAAQRSSVAFA